MTTERFWDFSVRTYRIENVAQACLSLQDDRGVDVNMLLFCCWCGLRVGRFDDALFDAASHFSDTWRENVVAKLREARRWMKHTGCHTPPMQADPCGQLREQIKQAEFGAEEIQENVLASLVSKQRSETPVVADVIADAVSNLARYFDHIDQVLSAEEQRKLTIIICAAFPDASREAVTAAFSGR